MFAIGVSGQSSPMFSQRKNNSQSNNKLQFILYFLIHSVNIGYEKILYLDWLGSNPGPLVTNYSYMTLGKLIKFVGPQFSSSVK